MRILVGVHGLPPDSVGGAERVALDLAQGFAARHEVILFHPLTMGRFVPGTVLERFSRGVHIVARAFSPPSSFQETYRIPGVEGWFESLLDRFSPDLCHLHHLTGLSLCLPLIARARNIPTVLTLHDHWMLCARGQLLDLDLRPCPGPSPKGCARCLSDQIALERPLGRLGRRALTRLAGRSTLLRPLELLRRQYIASRQHAKPGRLELERVSERDILARRALESVRLLTAPSEDLLTKFQTLGIANVPMQRVLNGVAPRGPTFTSLPTPPPLEVGFIGSLIPSKGVHVLLEAVRRCGPEVRCTVVGPTPPFHGRPDYGRELQGLARDSGSLLVGPVPSEEIPRWLRRFHLLVVPSIWPENAPLVIGEALREGVPVVASAIGGIPELLEPGVESALVSPGDEAALEAQLRALLRDPRRLRDWQRGAWERSLKSHTQGVSEWEQIYGSVLNSGP